MMVMVSRKPLGYVDADSPQQQDPYSQIAHCLIYQYDGLYGFAEPYFIHGTLRDLVLHYRETSLFEHNDELDTTLRVPIGLVDAHNTTTSLSTITLVDKVATTTTDYDYDVVMSSSPHHSVVYRPDALPAAQPTASKH